MSILDDLGNVISIDEPSRDPNWWRNYAIPPEQHAQHMQAWSSVQETILHGMERTIAEGGGFGGRGSTHHGTFPDHIVYFLYPLKGHFSEAAKKQLLQTLEVFAETIKREIENA